MDSPARFVTAGTLAIVVWGALAFGAVYEWSYVPLLVACALVGVVGLLRGRPMAPAARAVIVALACALGAALIQLVPLPVSWLRVLSPSADVFLQQYSITYAIEGTRHPLSINPRTTALGVAFLAAFVLFLAGLLRGLTGRAVRRLVAAAVVFGALLALLGIVQKALVGDHAYMGMKIYGVWTPESKLVQPFGPYVNRNHFAGWMLMCIPLAVGYLCAGIEDGLRGARGWRSRLVWLSSPTGGRTLLVGFAVLLMGMSVVMSMSRSGMAAFALTALIMGTATLKLVPSWGGRAAVAALFAALVLGPAAWLGVGTAVERFSSDSVGSVETRLRAWSDARTIIRDFPITGTGLNTFGTATAVYQTGSRETHFREAHNEYLQLLAEGGLLLGVPVAAAILLFARAVRQRFREDGEDRTTYWIRFGAVAGVIAVAVQSLVEFSLQMPGNAAFFVVLLAVAMHRPARAAGRRSERAVEGRAGGSR